MPDDVPPAVKDRRNQVLLETQETISEERNRALVGRTIEVLVEGPSKHVKTKWMGRADTNQIVCFEAGRDWTGRFVQVEILESTPLTLNGKLV